MGAQTLETYIAINARIGSGFAQVGATLTELGSIVDKMSNKLINFGEESIEVYKNYEKSMREAEIALSTHYGRNTRELSDAMDQLNAKATEWAASTIFHTDDVADAINQAAHAGWDLDEILNGLPVAMQLAQAGSMDLSESLTYITKTMKAFDVPYEELGEFVDMWVYAANSSTGDVQDFGDAMKKLGATMRFTDSKEELFALIGLMHDMGESGSTAATLLRTSMMRIIAPSGVASKVMEQLGATDEEIREIREDASKLAALQTLEDYGFSAFNEDNQAKPMIQIYAELGEVLAQIAGGYENITKNQTTLGILSTIFGTRGITGALDIVTALQNAVELRDELLAGKAEGYGEYAMEKMADTLYGKTELFESKVERLKQVVGETLSGRVEEFYGSFGQIIDNVADLDEGKMDALVSGLGVIAAAGPGLIAAGTFFRLLGLIMNPVTGIGLGLVALTAAAAAIKELEQYDFEQNFGDMNMDVEGITSYVKGLAGDFKEAWTYTDQFKEALTEAVASYREAGNTFSSNLFSMMIQGTELQPDDLKNLLSMAEKMNEYAQEALYTAASGDTEYWVALFGGDEAVQNDPILQSIIEKTNRAYEESKSELEQIGADMRKTITDAWTNDNTIDEAEYNQILEYFRKYNDMVARAAAEAQSEESRIQMRKWLLQASTGSYDDIKTLAQTAVDEREAMLQKEYDLYLDKKARLIEHGGDTEELERADAIYQQRRQEIESTYDEFLLSLWDSQIANGGQYENYEKLAEIARQYQANGLTGEAANQLISDLMGDSAYAGGHGKTSDRAVLGKMLGVAMISLGGVEGVASKISQYEEAGNAVMATRLRQLYAMEQLINNFDLPQSGGDHAEWLDFLLGDSDYQSSNERLPGYGTAGTYLNDVMQRGYQKNKGAAESMLVMGGMSSVADAKAAIGLFGQGMESIYGLMTVIGQAARGELEEPMKEVTAAEANMSQAAQMVWQSILEGITANYDMEALNKFGTGGDLADYFAVWNLLYGGQSGNPEAYRITQPEQPGQTEAAQAPAPQKAQIEPMATGEGAGDAIEQLREQGVEVTVSADATELTATIDAEDGRDLMTYINGDATDLHAKIMDEDGQTLLEIVNGDVSALAAAIESQNGKTITVYVQSVDLAGGTAKYAAGGRATEASIFGEAGPEWAIPEKHDQRTAELLNAAREASGFTWPELIAQFGGLNANTERQPTTLIYSPTINAQNAEGVEQVLQDDRRRFEKWFEDKQMRDAAEVYA